MLPKAVPKLPRIVLNAKDVARVRRDVPNASKAKLPIVALRKDRPNQLVARRKVTRQAVRNVANDET